MKMNRKEGQAKRKQGPLMYDPKLPSIDLGDERMSRSGAIRRAVERELDALQEGELGKLSLLDLMARVLNKHPEFKPDSEAAARDLNELLIGLFSAEHGLPSGLKPPSVWELLALSKPQPFGPDSQCGTPEIAKREEEQRLARVRAAQNEPRSVANRKHGRTTKEKTT
jgi:hypothetical protein